MNKKQLIDELRYEGFSEKIIKAFERIRREDFVLDEWKDSAYINEALPLVKGATISQPYTIAFMLDLLKLDRLKENAKILEIGSGSGYVLALIDKICNCRIYGIEIIEELVKKSKLLLRNKKNIKIVQGNGLKHAGEFGSYDRILVSAAADDIPENLIEHLNENGIIVSPVRNSIFQIRKNKKINIKEYPGFVFVPLIK
ncbi:methyltransferase domain-containing protein [Candidatus Pacearchaeota archaeon]|nr:methyltransferase domain-containing protein [Candidatus Pacearchaeota archaeon]MBD3283445.1 methyltransferase domain-containing protein [Candidatus Pacearchaeota archaeon]